MALNARQRQFRRNMMMAAMYGAASASRRSDAAAIIGEHAQGMAVSFMDGSMVVRDTATPANNFMGSFQGKLSITGALPLTNLGALFNASNHATFAVSGMPSIATAITFMVEFLIPTLSGTQTVMCLDNGTTAHRHIAYTSGGNYTVQTLNASVTQATFGSVAYTANTVGRLAYAMEANSANVAFDGSLRTLDTSCAMPTGVTTLRFGRNSAGQQLDGYIRRMLILPRRLSDDEITLLSAVRR